MGLTLFVEQWVIDPQSVAEQARQFMAVDEVVHGGHFDGKWLKAQQEACLIYDQQGFRFVAAGRVLCPDWLKLARRVIKAGRKTEGLLRALKLAPGARVVDATAGLGVDALLMASTGAQVTMIEKHPILALLLSDQLLQIQREVNWRSITPRLSLIHDDAVKVLNQSLDQHYDVVYLDPMFEAHSYRAKVGGNMQLLHDLSDPPDRKEQLALLQASMRLADKVVVKRAAAAPCLAGLTPQAASMGDSVRYDIYTLNQVTHHD